MPGTAGLPSSARTPSSVSRIDFGWPGRLRISACFRMTPTWRENGGRHEIEADLPHLFAKTRHEPVGNRQRRFRRHVARRRAGPASGQYQMAAERVDQFDQGPFDCGLIVRDEAGSIRQGEVSAVPNHACSAGIPLSSRRRSMRGR